MATVTMTDVRAAQLCSVGARDWFKLNGLNWALFLKQGLPEDVILATKDGLAIKAVEAARARENGF